jgi:protein-disulfide isomerase
MLNKKIALIGVLVVLLAGSFALARVFTQKKNKDAASNQEGKSTEIKNEGYEEPKKIRPIGNEDRVFANRNAQVQVIVYCDFSCPFCTDFSGTLDRVAGEYSDRIAIAFRYFPLQSHTEGFPSAVAAECAGEQGKWAEMYKKLFEANKSGRLSSEQYFADASALGLDAEKFKNCFDQKKYKEKIAASIVEGEEVGAIGTPTIFVDNEIYPGALPYEDYENSEGEKVEGLKSIIERHLE